MKTPKTFYINRRHFLKGSFASLVLSQFGVYGFDLVHPTKPYRVGLIGCGWYGKNDLYRLIQVTQIEVVALCDVDAKMLADAAVKIQERLQDPKKVARLCARILAMKRPKFRYIIGMDARLRNAFRRLLPFELYRLLVNAVFRRIMR